MPSKLEASPDGLKVWTPYNQTFVDELKYIIPASKRRFTKQPSAHWIVDPAYGQDMADLILRIYGEVVTVPGPALATGPELKIVRVEYIGRCKDGMASGFCEGSWSVRLSEQVLRAWFCDEIAPDGTEAAQSDKSLYAILGLKGFSEASLIKPAYRRMAKQWHPDVCREEGAKERFQAITHAWEILGNDKLRRKYDCGLIFQERAERPAQHRKFVDMYGYRSPLRCGLICAMGTMKLGQFCIESILKWDDILDSAGRTMVSSWPVGSDSFQIDWS